MGTLKLLKRDINSGAETQIWQTAGNKGAKWREVQLTVKSSDPFKVTKYSSQSPTRSLICSLDAGGFKDLRPGAPSLPVLLRLDKWCFDQQRLITIL